MTTVTENAPLNRDSPPASLEIKIRGRSERARDALSERMTPAQIAEAQRLAREWMAAFEKRKKK